MPVRRRRRLLPPFALSHLSTWDYFHPNTSGQRLLAEITYTAAFDL